MITNTSTLPTLLDLIHEQGMRIPEKTAVIIENEEITYQELNSLINQLGNFLIKRGVQPETLIGVCLDRSLEMVIAILGILRAGGAFIPLDPSYPSERLLYYLMDADAQFVITNSNLLGIFRQTGKKIICMENVRPTNIQQPFKCPEKDITPENLAYVIYTSGSTGRPKGVMVTHASLSNFVQIANSVLDVTKEDIYLHSASIAYALSIRQLMIPLSYGATIVLGTNDQVFDPVNLSFPYFFFF